MPFGQKQNENERYTARQPYMRSFSSKSGGQAAKRKSPVSDRRQAAAIQGVQTELDGGTFPKRMPLQKQQGKNQLQIQNTTRCSGCQCATTDKNDEGAILPVVQKMSLQAEFYAIPDGRQEGAIDSSPRLRIVKPFLTAILYVWAAPPQVCSM